MSPRVRAIIEAVALEHGVRVKDILSRTRAQPATWARLDAMWRVRQLAHPNGQPVFSYPAIGKIFGRDHATVLNGCRRWTEIAGVRERRAA